MANEMLLGLCLEFIRDNATMGDCVKISTALALRTQYMQGKQWQRKSSGQVALQPAQIITPDTHISITCGQFLATIEDAVNSAVEKERKRIEISIEKQSDFLAELDALGHILNHIATAALNGDHRALNSSGYIENLAGKKRWVAELINASGREDWLELIPGLEATLEGFIQGLVTLGNHGDIRPLKVAAVDLSPAMRKYAAIRITTGNQPGRIQQRIDANVREIGEREKCGVLAAIKTYYGYLSDRPDNMLSANEREELEHIKLQADPEGAAQQRFTRKGRNNNRHINMSIQVDK